MILLGVTADDFTGATDLANNLVLTGMRVVETIGVPAGPLGEEVDAVVVALKSRTIASRAYAAREEATAGITIVIEPINTRDIPGFFFNRQDDAQAICEDAGAANSRCRWISITARLSRATSR